MKEADKITPEGARIGAALRAARDRLSLTNADIAAGMGVSEVAVKKILKGVGTVQYVKLGQLCRLLKITPNDLLGFNGSASLDLLRGNLESSYSQLGLSDGEAKQLAEIVLEGLQEPPIRSVELPPLETGRIQGELAFRKFSRAKPS